MGGKRNLLLGRCAALLFLCGAIASLPTNALLKSDADAYALNALALVSAILCAPIPWNKLHRRALHLLGVIATAEVTVAVVVHAQYATLFKWYFVLVAVFAAHAFRRRREAIAQIAGVVTGMVATALYANRLDPDALANALVAILTVCVAAGVVICLRETSSAASAPIT